MLESHHSLVVNALQNIYKLCVRKEGFPGEPLAETSDGFPLTHAILDRLGLITQAEDTSETAEEESEDLQYLRVLSNPTDCTATADPSPEPATPPGPASNLTSPVQVSPGGHVPLKWEFQPIQQGSYHGYPQSDFRPFHARLPLETPAFASESKTTAGTSTEPMSNPYLYYTEGVCHPEHTDNQLQPIATTGPTIFSATTAPGLTVDMAENYHLHLPNQQDVYHPRLAAPWTYSRE